MRKWISKKLNEGEKDDADFRFYIYMFFSVIIFLILFIVFTIDYDNRIKSFSNKIETLSDEVQEYKASANNLNETIKKIDKINFNSDLHMVKGMKIIIGGIRLNMRTENKIPYVEITDDKMIVYKLFNHKSISLRNKSCNDITFYINDFKKDENLIYAEMTVSGFCDDSFYTHLIKYY